MNITDFNLKAISEYLQSVISPLESIRIVPPAELNGNEKKYFTDSYIENQLYLVIEPSHGFQSMDLSQLYSEVPESLSNILRIEPYKHPEKEGFICVISVYIGCIDVSSRSVQIDGTEMENFSEIIQTIQNDFRHISTTSELEPIKIVSSSPSSATIKANKSLLVSSTNSGKRPERYSTLHTYISGIGLFCNRIFSLRDSDYYRLVLKPPGEKEHIQRSRNYFIDSYLDSYPLKCIECDKDTISASENRILYCSNCQSTFFRFVPDKIPLTEQLSEVQQGNWRKYISSIPDSLKQSEPQILQYTQLRGEKQPIYIHQSVQEELKIYIPSDFETIWIPFSARNKELAEEKPYTDHLRNNSKSVTDLPLVCFTCSKEETEFTHIIGLWISTQNSLVQDDVNVCTDCKESFESQLKYIREQVDINTELLSQNI